MTLRENIGNKQMQLLLQWDLLHICIYIKYENLKLLLISIYLKFKGNKNVTVHNLYHVHRF